MNTVKITMVRVYLTECKKNTDKIIDHLKKKLHIRGATVFRGISGYGDSGDHQSMLINIVIEAPIVIEFFDEPHKITTALNYLSTVINAEHIVSWDASVNS